MESTTTMKILVTQEQIEKSVQKCAAIINEKFADTDILVVCILKGAVYFFTDMTRKLKDHSCYFIEATSYHDSQSQTGLSIFNSITPKKFANKHIILIDELYDGGKTINEIKTAIHEKAAVPLDKIFTCTLFKKNKVTEFAPPDLYGILIPDVWVVGYGLDDKQEKRNYRNLYAVPKVGDVPKTEDDKIFDDVILWDRAVNEIAKYC